MRYNNNVTNQGKVIISILLSYTLIFTNVVASSLNTTNSHQQKNTVVFDHQNNVEETSSVSSTSLLRCEETHPLGLSTGEIQDWQLTASSEYPKEWEAGCQVKYARAYQPNGKAWCARTKSISEWLQIDLGVPARITTIITQGRGDGKEWVTRYKLSYGVDDKNWNYYHDAYGSQKIFDGNKDAYKIRSSYLNKAIYARFVRFHPVAWNRHPSMRVELVGCYACKSLLGTPPYGKFKASNSWWYNRGSSCQAYDGYIYSSKAWCSRSSRPNQWLQVDVGPPTVITGLVTRGRGDTKRRNWITKFKISYSNDSNIPENQWNWYKDEFGHLPQIFIGNSNRNKKKFNYFDKPFVARFVRVHPVVWHNHIGLRFGVLGCPYKGPCSGSFTNLVSDTPCIENLAYNRPAWLFLRKHRKRTTGRGDYAKKAVDGNADDPKSCVQLDNWHAHTPMWTVDLGTIKTISGAIIQTEKSITAKVITKLLRGQSKLSHNLEKLSIYVSKKPVTKDLYRAIVNGYAKHCSSISRLNEALQQPTLHFECKEPIDGRYLIVRAWGMRNRKNREFNAIICEVIAYE